MQPRDTGAQAGGGASKEEMVRKYFKKGRKKFGCYLILSFARRSPNDVSLK